MLYDSTSLPLLPTSTDDLCKRSIQIELQDQWRGATLTRSLLADIGGGSALVPVDLALSDLDIERCETIFVGRIGSGGAIAGDFEVHAVSIAIPALNLTRLVNVMAVPAETLPNGLQGIACFRFLNAFTYGNGGNPAEFALQMP